MLQIRTGIPSIGVFLVLLAGLMLMPTAEGIAAKKKASSKTFIKKVSSKKGKRSKRKSKCQPKLGLEQALQILRTDGTDELQKLAGMNGLHQESRVTRLELSSEVIQQQLQQEGEDITELENEDDVPVNLESFKFLWLSYVDAEGGKKEENRMASGIEKQQVMDAVMDWLGTRYHFGGESRSGIDCSAFVRAVFGQSGSIMLPRTAQSQITVGADIKREDMQFGDMIFFHTMRHAYVSHVGIYLGNNLFAHSSSRFGVTISSLESTYYSNRLIGVRRITPQDVEELSIVSNNIVTR